MLKRYFQVSANDQQQWIHLKCIISFTYGAQKRIHFNTYNMHLKYIYIYCCKYHFNHIYIQQPVWNIQSYVEPIGCRKRNINNKNAYVCVYFFTKLTEKILYKQQFQLSIDFNLLRVCECEYMQKIHSQKNDEWAFMTDNMNSI